MLSKIYLWIENHLASTGFVCFLILMPVYLIFQKKSCVFTEVWSYPERVLEHYWGPAAWPGQWPEPDSCLHRGGWRQITIPIYNSHIEHQQLSTGQLRLYVHSLTMTICPGLESIRRAASGEPCLVHRLQWNLPVSHPSRLVVTRVDVLTLTERFN